LGVSGKYLLLLSGELRITQNMAGYLLTLENRPIIGPGESDFWPHREALGWHRQNVFRGGEAGTPNHPPFLGRTDRFNTGVLLFI
jgi:hypothetical protein